MDTKQIIEGNKPTAYSRKHRVVIVNEVIKDIAGRGRKFFYHEGRIAEIVDKGHIYYKAEYGTKEYLRLSTPDYRRIKGWFHGGTLLHLVKEFRDYIKDGNSSEYSTLNSPHWGYPEEDMKEIRKKAIKLGFLIEN